MISSRSISGTDHDSHELIKIDTDELTPARKSDITTACAKIATVVPYSTDRSVVLLVKPVAAGK